MDNLFQLFWICLGIVLAAVLARVIVFFLVRRQSPDRPAAGNTLITGVRLLRKLDLLDAQVKILTVALFCIAPILYSIYVTARHFGLAVTGHPIEFATLFVCIALFCMDAISQLSATRKQRKAVRLKYESRLITAEALDPIMFQGYFIFHDLVIDDHCFDHIAVGSKGIFVIVSGTESVFSIPEKEADNRVTYNGRSLVFPKGSDHLTLQEALSLEEWISDWLSERLNELVAARAIVCLPGWTVRRTTAQGISVINPRQFDSLFQYMKPRSMDPDTVHHIARLLKQYHAGISSNTSICDNALVSASGIDCCPNGGSGPESGCNPEHDRKPDPEVVKPPGV